MLYNDQPPTGNAPSSFGHSKGECSSVPPYCITNMPLQQNPLLFFLPKGVVMLDRQTGVWLSHSAPKFPADGRTFWPDSANNNAQTFMCVTYSYDTFSEIG